MAPRTNMEKSAAMTVALNKGMGRQVLNAVRKIQGKHGGASLHDIKRFLSTSLKLDMKTKGDEVNVILKNIKDRGILTKEGSIYKLADGSKIAKNKKLPDPSPELQRKVKDMSSRKEVLPHPTVPESLSLVLESTEKEDNQNQKELQG